jgi:hypothetical protein
VVTQTLPKRTLPENFREKRRAKSNSTSENARHVPLKIKFFASKHWCVRATN